MSIDDRNYVTGYLDMRTRMGWQRRWCELRSDTCTFSRSHEKKDMSKSKPINLSNIGVQMITESKSGKRFIIDTEDSIEMKAESAEVAEEWVRQIHCVQDMHNVKPVVVPDVVPRDYDSFRQILADKDAEIARLRAEVHWLRQGGAVGDELSSEYGSAIDRLHNKVSRAGNLEQMELLQTDSDSSDDEALFEDAQSLFASVEDSWSDEEEMRPRTDSFGGGARPVITGGSAAGGGAAGGALNLPSPVMEEGASASPSADDDVTWVGPLDAPKVGLNCVPRMDIKEMGPQCVFI